MLVIFALVAVGYVPLRERLAVTVAFCLMKLVLDIHDNEVGFMMELLRSLSFVEAKPLPVGISDEKAQFLIEFGQAVDELNDVLSGKNQVADAYSLLDGL